MIHRRQQVAGLTRPALSAPEAGEARGSSQLPGKSLTSCRLERLPEAFHGVGDRPRRAAEEKQFTLPAEQLGTTPSLFSPLHARERVINDRKALPNPLGGAQALRELGKQIRVKVQRPRRGALERCAQESRTGGDGEAAAGAVVARISPVN